MSVESRTRRAWRTWWRLEEKNATLVFSYPKPGTPSENVLWASADDGTETVTFAGAVGAWFRDTLGDDGYRQTDAREGKVVLLCDAFSLPDDTGGSGPLTRDGLRALAARSNVKAAFNGDPVTILTIDEDTRADTLVVTFREIT